MENSELYEDVINDCFGYSLGAIWDYFQYREPVLPYEERIDKFLFILRRAMATGILKLANDGVFFDGSISEQLKKFEEGFPKKERDMHEFCFGLDIYGKLWFPGGGVWICSDGDEIWT